MTKVYEPMTGSMPHRAIEFLRKSGATCLGREVSTAVVADFLGTDVTTLSAAMKPARESGLVRVRRIAGKGATYWWCLGKGESDLPDDHEPDAPMREHRPPSGIGKPGPLFPGVDASSDGQKAEVPMPTLADWARPQQHPANEVNEAMPDALLSVRTGAITLVGLRADARGRIEVPAELVACIKRYIAWGPAT